MSLTSLRSVLLLSVYRSYTSFARFIPKYFICIDATVNGIAF